MNAKVIVWVRSIVVCPKVVYFGAYSAMCTLTASKASNKMSLRRRELRSTPTSPSELGGVERLNTSARRGCLSMSAAGACGGLDASGCSDLKACGDWGWCRRADEWGPGVSGGSWGLGHGWEWIGLLLAAAVMLQTGVELPIYMMDWNDYTNFAWNVQIQALMKPSRPCHLHTFANPKACLPRGTSRSQTRIISALLGREDLYSGIHYLPTLDVLIDNKYFCGIIKHHISLKRFPRI